MTIKKNKHTAGTIRKIVKDKVFVITFIKRTDGSVRKMNCRCGVKKGVTGEGLAFDPASKNLLSVWDVRKKSFRFVNLDTVTEMVANKVRYTFV